MPKRKAAFATKKIKTEKSGRGGRRQEYKGVTYKSDLEVYCAKALEREGLLNDYEGVTFTIQPAFTCPATSIEFCYRKDKETKVRKKVFIAQSSKVNAITYTPDFPNLKEGWVIECKGHKNEAFPNRWKMFKKFLYDNSLNITIYMPNDNAQIEETIAHIKANR